ncbi:hypothetical protein SBOR_0395 [Sclerotinia borealis F-4128]|uniref:DUF7924 domain-containing protein n=1 Tax=Sclerotinia borealis (strain F-4128) TaxID=1432307 RepID=W9CSS5_SCLBF|nr:hypothetical protein SBOR_0395 [Sclerotinia borealis F-4128]
MTPRRAKRNIPKDGRQRSVPKDGSKSQEPEGPSSLSPSEPLRKQRRASPAIKDTSTNNSKTNSIDYWIKEGRWPKEYFNQDDQTRKDFGNFNEIPWLAAMGLNHLLVRNAFRGKPSEASSVTSSSVSDRKPREVNTYKHANYVTALASKNSFMKEFVKGIEKVSSDLCQTLLFAEQTYPKDSLFREDRFKTTCNNICDRNESIVVRDIGQLIVPSAQNLATCGAAHLEDLIDSANEGWKSAKPFLGPRPQPDYSVGFKESAFTHDQLEKLKPYVGEGLDTSPSHSWLSCRYRQNAHSMTLAVRGVVDLFRLVKREKELHLQILAFSISHDHLSVRIYGHYPVIDGDTTKFYRHPIRNFGFTELDGKEKWSAYQFTRNVYDIWMPTHLERIRSVIDSLTGFEVSQQSESYKSGLSQVLNSQHLSEPLDEDGSYLWGEAEGSNKNPKKRGIDGWGSMRLGKGAIGGTQENKWRSRY